MNGKCVSYAELREMLRLGESATVARMVAEKFAKLYDVVTAYHAGSGIVCMVYDSEGEPVVANKNYVGVISESGIAVEAEVGEETERPHYCGDDTCEWDCGYQSCGVCIDVCRCNDY